MIATVVAAPLWGRTRMAKWLPAPLVALLAGTSLSLALARAGHPVRTIGALYEVLVGNRVVNLPEVFQRIQAAAP